MPERFRREFHEALQLAKQADLETAILREVIRSTPGLFWAKWRLHDGSYRMIAVSRDYAEAYLGSRDTLLYEGRQDAVIWGEEAAAHFRENDDRAINLSGRVEVSEPICSPLTGKSGTFKGWKWPVMVDGHAVVCGMGVHLDD
jgi:hypothetical protein